MFVRDRRDQKVTVRMSDGSTMTLPPPSFVAMALERLALGGRTSSGQPGAASFLDVGCGTGYVTALAACLVGDKGEGRMGRGVSGFVVRYNFISASDRQARPLRHASWVGTGISAG